MYNVPPVGLHDVLFAPGAALDAGHSNGYTVADKKPDDDADESTGGGGYGSEEVRFFTVFPLFSPFYFHFFTVFWTGSCVATLTVNDNQVPDLVCPGDEQYNSDAPAATDTAQMSVGGSESTVQVRKNGKKP